MIEVRIKDEIKVFDTVGDMIEAIREIISTWIGIKDQKEPIVINIKKLEARGPPALGVSVNDTMKAKAALG